MIDWFNKFWELYSSAFPADERRSLDHQKEVFDNPLYFAEPIFNKNEWAGFITWWKFPKFIYVEYFAIDKKFRNKGLGQSFLKSFTEKHHSIVLEVEIPNDKLSKRRVNFYKRLGFKLMDNQYLQPAYDSSKQPVPLKIMIFPKNSNLDFQTIKNTLYERVYKK